jgi:hypothetical protein
VVKVSNILDRLALSFICLVGIWIVFALALQITAISLHFAGREDILSKASNWFTWKFDGRFKNSPGNIWYEEPKDIAIGNIVNKVKIGPVAGNRKLEFGVKNVIEEVLQDKGYDIDHSSKKRLDVDIVYLDVLKTQSSFSVMHKNTESVVIRLYGTVTNEDGKIVKKALVEEAADETSVSTLLIDEGGKFNQQNLSTALKKACNSLVNKLL